MSQVTFNEILVMREQLDAALERVIGQPIAYGFNFEISKTANGICKLAGAFSYAFETECLVNGQCAQTVEAAFESAMGEIAKLQGPGVEDTKQILALKAKIKELGGRI